MAARVLVIEDDLISQDIIKSGLEAHGFEVDVTGDGFSAVRLLKEGRHDVALVDYHLPELDGYASARLLRELTDTDTGPKLIAITANANALMARPNADDLFEAVLNKPLELFAQPGAIGGKTLPLSGRAFAYHRHCGEPGRRFWRAVGEPAISNVF